MKKKILSMVMAAAMVLSVSSVSQAAQTTVEQKDGKYAVDPIVASGSYEAPTIKVTLSDTTDKKVIVNPYSLKVDKIASVATTEQNEQLINKIESITNDSDVALAVNATLSVDVAGNTKIATAAVVPETEKGNSIFAFLKMEAGAAAATTMPNATYDAKGEGMAAFASKPVTKKAIVTLDKTGGAKPVASYKIMGTVAANPTTPWAASDTVKFTMVFDFEPRIPAKSGS